MSRSAALAVTVLLSALVAGCGSGQTAQSPATQAVETSAPSLSPKSVPKAAKSSNDCKDVKGDATSNDLTSVTLKRNGDNLDVTWTVAKVDTGPDTAGFYLSIASDDENSSGQLGVKYIDGRQIGYFNFDGSMNTNISGEATVTASSVTGSFPMSELDKFGPKFKWQAATSAKGADMDFCPGTSFGDKFQFTG